MVAGRSSFASLVPNDVTAVGNSNFATQPNTVGFTNVVLLGHANEWSVSSGVSNCIFVCSDLATNRLNDCSNSLWMSAKTPVLTGVTSDMRNSVVVHPGALASLTTGGLNNQLVVATGDGNAVGVQNVLLSGGAASTSISLEGSSNNIVLCNRESNVAFPAVQRCAYLGSGAALPNLSNQLAFDHSSIRAANLGTDATLNVQYRPLYHSAATGVVRLSAAPRLAVYSGITDGNGQVALNISALGLALQPIVTATVVSPSTTLSLSVHVLSLTTTLVLLQVTQAFPQGSAGSDITVHCHVAF